jgi:hypothetical protein
MAVSNRTSGARQDTWIITMHLNGQPFGIWDKKTGGEIDSDDNKYYPGGMQPPLVIGGRRTTGNVTLQRIYDRIDDHGKINTLLAAAGRGGKVDIGQRPLDQDGNGSYKAITYTGILKRVQVPEVDSESSTAAMVEIEVSIDGYPSAQ